MRDERYGDEGYWSEGISPARRAFDRAFLRMAGGGVRWLIRHWLLVANASNVATVAGALLSPFLIAQGLLAPGQAIFAVYGLICAQNPAHSYFLWGHQMALDQRMLAIYAAVTAAGLLYGSMRRQLSPLSWRAYLALAAPMAVDGFTQLFGWRHSTWELRSATGALFGMASVWWLYPRLDLTIAGIRPWLPPRQ